MVNRIEIRESPGKFIIRPDSSPGTIDAVESYAKEIAKLQKENPGKNIQFLPLAFVWSGISKGYALNGILAIVS